MLTSPQTSSFNVPVLIIFYNRPGILCKTIEQIRKIAPKSLYLACDGPKESAPDDLIKVMKCREVASDIDWDCQVHFNYRDVNLGCRICVSDSISWFFTQVEEGIIIEDDCYPTESFFYFCQELLIRYRHDQNIGMISGENSIFPLDNINGDYVYSRYPNIWGWATWRRVWKDYDVNIMQWPNNKKKILKSMEKKTARYWKLTLDKTYENKINTWDYQLVYLFLLKKYKCIIPRKSYIRNIGFSSDATHTKNIDLKYDKLDLNEAPIKKTLQCNKVNNTIDNHLDKNVYKLNTINYLKEKIRSLKR